MKIYNCLCLNISQNGIYIVCTDEDTVQWIAEQIGKLSPNANINSLEVNKIHHLPQTGNLIRSFKQLDGKDYGIGLYLVQQLCKNGWEPVGNIKFFSIGFEDITLRKCHES